MTNASTGYRLNHSNEVANVEDEITDRICEASEARAWVETVEVSQDLGHASLTHVRIAREEATRADKDLASARAWREALIEMGAAGYAERVERARATSAGHTLASPLLLGKVGPGMV